MNNKIKKNVTSFLLLVAFTAAGLFFAENTIKRIMANNSNHSEIMAKSGLKQSIKLLFIGDMMFDRYIRQVQEKKGGDFIFIGVKKLDS